MFEALKKKLASWIGTSKKEKKKEKSKKNPKVNKKKGKEKNYPIGQNYYYRQMTFYFLNHLDQLIPCSLLQGF